MSRVLLFVQTGDEQPKCMRAWDGDPDMIGAHPWHDWRAAWIEWLLQHRWWLVECENAEAGRLLIQESLCNKKVMVRGRIFAAHNARRKGE
mgnify:CR=1 FL=1